MVRGRIGSPFWEDQDGLPRPSIRRGVHIGIERARAECKAVVSVVTEESIGATFANLPTANCKEKEVVGLGAVGRVDKAEKNEAQPRCGRPQVSRSKIPRIGSTVGDRRHQEATRTVQRHRVALCEEEPCC